MKITTQTVLTGGTLTSVNSLEDEAVAPVRRKVALSENYELPPFSCCVLRIPAKPLEQYSQRA